MKNYFKNLLNGFIKASIIKKIFIFLIIALYVFILIICFKKVNVEVITPGVVNNPSLSVSIESEEEDKYIGTIGIYTYQKISLLQYWLSKSNNEFTVTEINDDTNLTDNELLDQGVIMKDNSITNALINAYREASKTQEEVKIENLDTLYKGVTVTAIYKYASTELKVGDLIVAVNGQKFRNISEFNQICSEIRNDYDYLRFSVVKGEETKTVYANFVERPNSENKNKVLGIAIDDTYDLPKTTPEYTISGNYKSVGPSGGAMIALALYDKLTPGDITKGKKIVGTGTIDFEGNIGAIGGIEQKIVTAKNYAVDIFFVDQYDYEEAKIAKEKHQASFELVSVETFSDIIKYLNGLEEE